MDQFLRAVQAQARALELRQGAQLELQLDRQLEPQQEALLVTHLTVEQEVRVQDLAPTV